MPAAVVRLSNGRTVQMGGKFVYTAKKDMSTVTLAGVDADKGSKLSLWYFGNAEAGGLEPVAVWPRSWARSSTSCSPRGDVRARPPAPAWRRPRVALFN